MKNIFYVLSPGYYKTGGTELLHQLVYEINRNNGIAYMIYIGADSNKRINPAFEKYIKNYYIYEDIVDNEASIIIVPEIYTGYLKKFKKAKKIVWWESVDNYVIQKYRIDLFKSIFKNIINKVFKFKKKYDTTLIPKKLSIKKLRRIDKHLIQSYYAGDFLDRHNIHNYVFLSDYINETYLANCETIALENKEDIVCYNPKKGFKFTKKIIRRMPEVNFVPIENMTNDEVVSLLQRSKLYIDFGNHPGKDRFPREAASQYCCVITNKKGSAKFYNDVMIPDNYKYEDTTQNLDNIADAITNCLKNYKKCIDDFSDYRKFIMGEKNKFVEDVKTIFIETSY